MFKPSIKEQFIVSIVTRGSEVAISKERNQTLEEVLLTNGIVKSVTTCFALSEDAKFIPMNTEVKDLNSGVFLFEREQITVNGFSAPMAINTRDQRNTKEDDVDSPDDRYAQYEILKDLCIHKPDELFHKCTAILKKQQIQSRGVDILCAWIKNCIEELKEKIMDVSGKIERYTEALSDMQRILRLPQQLQETRIDSERSLLDFLPSIASKDFDSLVKRNLTKLKESNQCMQVLKNQIVDFERNDELESVSIQNQIDYCLEGIQSVANDQKKLLQEFEELNEKISSSFSQLDCSIEESWIDMNESPFSVIELQNRLREGKFLERARKNYNTLCRFYEQCENIDATFQRSLIRKINDLYYDLYEKDVCDISKQLQDLDLHDVKQLVEIVHTGLNLKKYYQLALEEINRRQQYDTSVRRAVEDANNCLLLLHDEESNKRSIFLEKFNSEKGLPKDIYVIISKIFPQLYEEAKEVHLEENQAHLEDLDTSKDLESSSFESDDETDLDSLDDASPGILKEVWKSKNAEIEKKDRRIQELENSLSLYVSSASNTSSDQIKHKEDEISKLREELNQLSENNVKLQEEVERLQSNEKSLTACSSILKEKCDATIRQCEGLQNDLKQKNARINKLQEKLSEIEQINAELKKLIAEREEMIEQRNNVINEKNQSCMNQSDKIQKLTSQISEFKSRINSLESINGKLHEELEKERRAIQQLKFELEEKTAKCVAHEETAKDNERKIKKMIESLEKVSNTLQVKLEKLDQAEKEKSNLETLVESLRAEMNSYKLKCNNLENDLDDCEAEIEEKDSQIKKLKLELDTVQNQFVALREQNAERNSKIQQLESIIEEEVNKRLEQVNELNHHIDLLNEEIAEKEDDIEDIKNSYDSKIKALLAQTNELKQNIAERDANIKDLYSQKESGLQQIGELAFKISELEQMIDERDSTIEKLSKSSAELQEFISNLVGKNAELEHERNELASDIEKIKQEYNLAKQSHEAKVSTLYQELDSKQAEYKNVIEDLRNKYDILAQRKHASELKLEQENGELKHKIKELDDKFNAQLEYVQQLTNEKEKSEKKLRDEMYNSYKSKLEEMQKQYELNAKKALARLEEENNRLKRELAAMNNEKEITVNQNKELEQMTKEINQLRKFKSEAEAFIQRATNLVSEKQNAIENLNATLTGLKNVLMNLASFMMFPELEEKLSNENYIFNEEEFAAMFNFVCNASSRVINEEIPDQSNVVQNLKINNFETNDTVIFLKNNKYGVWEALCKEPHYYLSPDAVRQLERSSSYNTLPFFIAKVLCVEDIEVPTRGSAPAPFKFLESGTQYHLVHIIMKE